MFGLFSQVQGWVKIKGATDGTKIGNTGDSLKALVTASALPTGASTEATLAAAKAVLDLLNAKDFATQTTLAALNSKDFATQTTLAAVLTALGTLNAKDFSTQTTLASVLAALANGTSTPALNQQSLFVRPIPYEPQAYRAATNGFAIATTATDVFRIIGSASKTVRVKRIVVSGRTTSGSPVACIIKAIKYSSVNTGGTSVTDTAVPIDSNNAAATAVVNHYTANPTLGTLVGNIDTRSITFQSSGLLQTIEMTFETPVVLHGVAEQLSVNFNSTSVTGSSICCVAEWEEV